MNQVDSRPRRQDGEPLQQLQRVEPQMRRPVRPPVPQCEPDLPLGTDAEPVLGEREPQRVPAEPFQAIALSRARHQPGVEIEPGDVRVIRPERHRRPVPRRVAAPAHARSRPRPERHSAIDGRRRGSEDRRPATLGAAWERCRMAGDKSPSNARRGGGAKGGAGAGGHPWCARHEHRTTR